ncbi:NUDIX domain-containing protein [Streptomyces sp. NPDC050509]|uniref:NUDIX domain-containing protein n=1 Tax=Streptomyces sp. NPDC050509 TaxID=3365620 RepID=UPI0037B09AA5
MAVEESAIIKELNHYLLGHPDETSATMPLFDALLDHSRQGLCLHHGSCPVVRAGAILMDEQGRALALRYGDAWGFAEGAPDPSDQSLSRTASRVLEEFAGVQNAWTAPGEEGPILVDASPAAPEDGRRTRYGFRYLFRAHSRVLVPAMAALGRARWTSLDEIGPPLLRTRLRDRLAVSR